VKDPRYNSSPRKSWPQTLYKGKSNPALLLIDATRTQTTKGAQKKQDTTEVGQTSASITKARYVFIDTLIIATASNPTPQLATDAIRTEKQVRKTQDTTAAPEKAGPKPSMKVSSSLALL
jgi:hypothetical protein